MTGVPIKLIIDPQAVVCIFWTVLFFLGLQELKGWSVYQAVKVSCMLWSVHLAMAFFWNVAWNLSSMWRWSMCFLQILHLASNWRWGRAREKSNICQGRCFGFRMLFETFTDPYNLECEWYWNQSIGSSENPTTSPRAQHSLKPRFLRCGNARVWATVSTPWRKQTIDETCETCHPSFGDDGPWVKHRFRCGCNFNVGLWWQFKLWNMHDRAQYPSFRRSQCLLHFAGVLLWDVSGSFGGLIQDLQKSPWCLWIIWTYVYSDGNSWLCVQQAARPIWGSQGATLYGHWHLGQSGGPTCPGNWCAPRTNHRSEWGHETFERRPQRVAMRVEMLSDTTEQIHFGLVQVGGFTPFRAATCMRWSVPIWSHAEWWAQTAT